MNKLYLFVLTYFIKKVIIVGMAFSLLTGCLSTQSITYFNQSSPMLAQTDKGITGTAAAYTPVIQPGDILSITVSSLDKEDREIFNPLPFSTSQQTPHGGFVVLQPIQGFKVDTAGCIHFPQIGAVKVEGMTTHEVELKLIDQLEPIVKSPTVFVYIANFIISVLGEVARPAQYVIPHNRITLPEALALAGDLTIYGKRQNVKIIREIDGKRVFGEVDLTNRNLFRSSYYHLRSGDLIYVEPTKGKLTSIDRTYQLAPIIISSLTFLLLIINTFK